MRVYEAIVKGLESVGVGAAFGGAGENAAGLMLALKDSETIRPIITRHEQAASFMACGYAMYTDKLGFCFATAGPGAFNLFSGLGVAMSDSYPVLVVSGEAHVEAAADALATALKRGKKIVALVGFGAIRSHAEVEVKRFIERFQIPLLTTLDGKGIVSEGHPLSVGVFCDSGHASAWKAFREADVVLAVGNAFNQHATFNYHDDLFTDKTLIHVNISATEIDKAYKADHALVSDARSCLLYTSDAADDLL